MAFAKLRVPHSTEEKESAVKMTVDPEPAEEVFAPEFDAPQETQKDDVVDDVDVSSESECDDLNNIEERIKEIEESNGLEDTNEKEHKVSSKIHKISQKFEWQEVIG